MRPQLPAAGETDAAASVQGNSNLVRGSSALIFSSRFGVQMRVVVVEDETRLARNVADGLRQGAG